MNFLEKLAVNYLSKKDLSSSNSDLYNYLWDSLPNFFQGVPIWKDWNTHKAVKEGLKASVWVYRCVNIRADALGQVCWIVEKKQADGTYIREEGHPIETLLKKPLPIEDDSIKLSGQDIFQLLENYLMLSGNNIWKLEIVGGVPIALYPLHPDRVRPVHGANMFDIDYYEYRPNIDHNSVIKIDPQEIVHFQLTDPDNPYWGLAPLMAAARVLDTDNEAVSWNKVALQNRAVPDGVFTINEHLTDDQYNQVRRYIREQHQGKDNARTPWLVSGGATWNPMSLSPADMDFLKGREFNKYEIHAPFGVDPLLTGSNDRSSRANKREARIDFWVNTMIPHLNDIKSALNVGLLPFWKDENIRINYDLSGISALVDMVLDRARTAKLYSEMGVPFNIINDRLGLGFPSIVNGDVPLVLPKTAGASVIATASADIQPEKKELTQETKEILWKSADQRRIKWEDRVVEDIARRFKTEKEFVVSAYLESGEEEAIKTIEDQGLAWKALLSVTYGVVIDFFGNTELQNIESQLPKSDPRRLELKQVDFSAKVRADVNKFINETTGEKIVSIQGTTKDKVNEIIRKGVKEDKTPREIAKDIKSEYERWEGQVSEEELKAFTSRSMTISRTEVGTAASYGNHKAAEVAEEEFNVIMGKVWIDSVDGDVRDSHINVNGGRAIPLSRKFDNGLDYPLDSNAPASEVINCRCVEGHEVLEVR